LSENQRKSPKFTTIIVIGDYTNMMKDIFGKALGINKPWFVADVNFDLAAKRLDINLDFVRGATFPFEQDGVIGEYKAYDTVEKEWRHLNFFEHECYLKARVPRIKTPDDKIHLMLPAWSGLQNGFTLLFEALIIQLCKSMPVHNVAYLVKASDHKIWSILDKYTETTRELSDYSQVTVVGMDETSIAKGHDYISLFVDLEKKKTIFVAEGKNNSTVIAFKEDLEKHNGDANNITDISCDMSPAFIKGVRENLPNAKITFDKFHILKLINKAVDEVRRTEAQNNPLLTGSRYIFLKNEKNLTEKERLKKEELQLSKLNNRAFRALSLRETFQQIYVAPTDESFEKLLKKWYFWATHSQLEPMKQAASTIKKHWDGILQWKTSQINNGILEGLNSVVQAAKRKARGYKFKHFKTIVYLITGGLNFSKVNSACLPT
jgi:transposase